MALEIRVLAAVLAIALQVQATLPPGAAGVRVAVSDLLLPPTLIYVGLWVVRSGTPLEWRMPHVGWWLLGITLSLSIALAIGYGNSGQLSSWALLNKWGGWIALVSYFIIGSVIVRAGGTMLRDEFLRTFLVAAVVIAFVNSVAFPWLLSYYTLPFGIEFNRATCGMQNANAFGFLMVVAALLALAIEKQAALYLAPLLTALWFSASRGALMAFAVGILVHLMLSPRSLGLTLRGLTIAILAIVVLTTAATMTDPVRLARAQNGMSPIGFLSSDRLDPKATGIRELSAQNQRAAELFARAPVFGQGLGYFIGATGTTLHNSALWLAIETGLVGVIAFTGFLLTAVWYLYLGREDPFLVGMMAVSAAFMAMSITGEFLYQRHLWLLLGLALAVPPASRRGA